MPWESEQPQRRSAVPWLRFLLVFAAFVFSWYGVLFGYAGLVGVVRLLRGETADVPLWMPAVGLMMALAWIAWLVLAGAWILQRRVHRFWPVSGLITGIGSVLFTFGFAIPFTFPAIGMAVVFVVYQFGAASRPPSAP